MGKYDELRAFYGRSPAERLDLIEAEIRAPLAEAGRLAQALCAAGPAAPELFGGRLEELIEILSISSAKLAEVAAGAAAVRAAAGAEGVSDAALHVFRHDLMTPLGTVRSVAGILARGQPGAAGLPPDFAAGAQALAAAVNELKDVLDALIDARGRE